MDYSLSLNQVASLPESFTPGGVYFDKETGGVYVAQDSSIKKQFGGTVTGISVPLPAGPFTVSNPGVNAIQKVLDTSSQGSTNIATSIVYINGAKLVAMGDGDTISYGGGLFGFLQSNLIQGKLFMLSTTDPGAVGFGGKPVSVEYQGSSLIISLVSVSYGTPYNKIIRWTVTSSNQVTRNDTVLTSGETSIPADIIIDESLLQETNSAVEEEPELVTLLKPYVQAVNAGTTQIFPKLFVKKKSAMGEMYKLYPASFNGNTSEMDGQFVIYPAILSYHGSSDDGQNPYFYSVRIIYANSAFIVQNVISFALPTSDGSSSLVLAQNGTWRSLPTAPKLVIGQSTHQGVISPVQGYEFPKSGLITANPAVGDTLINYESNQLMIGGIIRVETSYIYTGTNILFIPIPSTT